MIIIDTCLNLKFYCFASPSNLIIEIYKIMFFRGLCRTLSNNFNEMFLRKYNVRDVNQETSYSRPLCHGLG